MRDQTVTVEDLQEDLTKIHPADDRTEVLVQSGFRVRLDLRSGDWRCTSCSGKTMGSNLFQPQCDYCEKY